MRSLIDKAKPVRKDVWQLRLYVSDQTPRTRVTLANLRQICRQHLRRKYRLRIIDVLKHPALAKADQILAIPTLLRTFPEPVRRILGDLSNVESALKALGLSPA
jgi:circadian clock protein KaiB